MKKDRVFRGSPGRGSDFVFDAEVARAFDDMLVRSVPFYEEQQSMITEIARKFWLEGTRVYDLGCSTATTLINLASAIRWIHHGLVDNGVFVVTEKTLTNSSPMNRTFIDLYYDFKRRNGYVENEILRKREALENVLIPYRIDENVEMFLRNGFEIVETFGAEPPSSWLFSRMAFSAGGA